MELLNDILSTVKEECLCGTLPDLDVDEFYYDVDKSECTEIHTIQSGFKHFSKDRFSSPNGLIVCLEICISSKSGISVCSMNVQDYFTPIEGEFEYPKHTSHLTSVSKYQNGTSDSHHYINKIVPIEQVKEAYIDLIKDIQAFITTLKCRKQ
ncbi:MAG: hypothetical protein IKT53_03290 [Bacteroidaceae bacterium]|nr:hypothetical protein [Bacteroidaceae bacterium]